MSTLTVPKIKDLVNYPNQKYKNIFETLSNNHNNDSTIDNHNYTNIDLLPNNYNNDNLMKDELKSFLKNKLNNDK